LLLFAFLVSLLLAPRLGCPRVDGTVGLTCMFD